MEDQGNAGLPAALAPQTLTRPESPAGGQVPMKRREFISLLGSAAAGWPLVARAQQTAMLVVGYLGSTTPEMSTKRLAAFRKGLRDAGFEEGQNVAIEFRWADGHEERMPELVADLSAEGWP